MWPTAPRRLCGCAGQDRRSDSSDSGAIRDILLGMKPQNLACEHIGLSHSPLNLGIRNFTMDTFVCQLVEPLNAGSP